MIFAALILLAPYLQKRGSRFLLALTLLALYRFSLEFFRDPAATQVLGQMIGGQKALQWVLLVTGLVTGIIILILPLFIMGQSIQGCVHFLSFRLEDSGRTL